MELSRKGLSVNGQLFCEWPEKAIAPCPGDFPVRFPSEHQHSGEMFLEIQRVNGSIAEVTSRGTTHYFSLRQLRGNPWTGTHGFHLRWPEQSPPLLGGVDIPAAFRPAEATRRFAAVLYSAPDLASVPVATLSSTRFFEQFEIGDGTPVAAVYARTQRWSLLRLIDGRTGWLAPHDSGKFMSLERVVRLDATYLTGEWDRHLHSAPGSVDRFRAPGDPRRSWIGYLGDSKAPPEPVPLYAAPDRARAPVSTFTAEERWKLEMVSPLPDRGLDYPIVFSRRPGWIEVGLRDTGDSYRQEGLTRVWLQDSANRWTVASVPPEDREKLLSEVWGGEALPAAEVVETRWVSGVLWFRVAVRMGEACEFLPGPPVAEGWVKAHDKNGRSIVWFETYCD